MLCTALFLAACDKMEYSPYQKFDRNTPRNINQENIRRLLGSENSRPLRIAFIGDSQRFYDEAADFKDKVNSLDGIDLVILAGDISDFGLKQEMEWIHEIFSQLRPPYLAVVGNHDLVANGEEVYRRMFGETDFSFVFKGVRFVFHNTNGREYRFNGKVPDVRWLEQQCAPAEGVSHIIAVSHVPPYDVDFDPALRESYHQVFKNTGNFLVSLNGHLHSSGDSYPFNDHVRYINSNAVDKRQFLLLELDDTKLTTTTVSY